MIPMAVHNYWRSAHAACFSANGWGQARDSPRNSRHSIICRRFSSSSHPGPMAGTLPCIWRRWQKACHCLSLISKNFCCSCLLGGGKGTLKGVKVSELITFRRFSVSFTISGLGHEVLEVLLAPGFCTPKTPWPARIPWAPRSKGTMKRFQCHGVNLRKPRERERMASSKRRKLLQKKKTVQCNVF